MNEMDIKGLSAMKIDKVPSSTDDQTEDPQSRHLPAPLLSSVRL